VMVRLSFMLTRECSFFLLLTSGKAFSLVPTTGASFPPMPLSAEQQRWMAHHFFPCEPQFTSPVLVALARLTVPSLPRRRQILWLPSDRHPRPVATKRESFYSQRKRFSGYLFLSIREPEDQIPFPLFPISAQFLVALSASLA